jgi:hypothetical protein
MKRILVAGGLVLAALVLMVPAGSLYYESGGGKGCTSCHEMKPQFDAWHSSSHRGIACEKCHGGAFTPRLAFHWNNVNRLVTHLRGDVPERIGFGNNDVQTMMERCKSCHAQEFAQWQSGPHSTTYSRIFLDKAHNLKVQPIDDCLRCHGMQFEGGIRDLITPVNNKGPWRMVSADLANRPAIPCLSCHGMHREGAVLAKTDVQGRVAGPEQEINRPSLALFDRRTQSHIPVSALSIPAMKEGVRPVKMSPDQRQALCYQCHAPEAASQVGSGDDRTAMGVHEGLSCLACHQKHGQQTRASCATCHPRLSNCKLNVEKMDTTFGSRDSKHNVHWVKCADCHTTGIPKRREPAVQTTASATIDQTLRQPASRIPNAEVSSILPLAIRPPAQPR